MPRRLFRSPFLSPNGRAAFWAAMLVFFTVGFFQNSRPGWNVNSQFALACALAERGTFIIDAYHDKPGMETGDKAFFNGHFYTDKTPVVGMLGAPVVWAVRKVSLFTSIPFSYPFARWLAAWIVVGGSAALLAALLALLLIERGVRPADAARAAALCLAASPLLGYSILFFHYLPACAMLMLGFWLARRGGREETNPSFLPMFVAGLFVGLACWTLNTMAVPALILTIILAIANRRRLWALFPWALGGLAGALGYFIHNKIIFGSFGSSYAYEYDPYFRDAMARGLMGATWPPKLIAFALVTFHPFQGLFVWFPLIFLCLAGCIVWLLRPSGGVRLEAFAALAVFSLLLIYNSAYFMWWGGWAYAPRHLLPALPLLALGLVPWLTHRRARWAVWVIGIGGFLINAAAVAVDPQPPPGLTSEQLEQPHLVEKWPFPFLRLLGVFWNGGYTDHNFGMMLGLQGPASMIPLALLWIGAWLVLPRWTKGEPRNE